MYFTFFNLRFKSIRYLSLCYCELIQEDGIDLIGTIENLVSIDLSGCKCGDHVCTILLTITFIFVTLELNFHFFKQGIKGIANSNLRHSSFSGCKEITDLGLQKFCNQCPNLETLDLSNCEQLTDNAIKTLAFCCKFLTCLNLSGCVMVLNI